MKLNRLLGTSFLMSTLLAPTAMAADAPMTAEQKKAIEQVVHDYLLNNPEILVEVSQSLQKKQQEAMQGQANEAIMQNTNQLLNDKLTAIGNPKGKVTLVEFFDYQCIHCKKMDPVIAALVKNNDNLKVVFKEFPIFGKSSETASKAALAAAMQGKYKAMHDALMKQDKRLSDEMVMSIAKGAGLDMARLQKDMKSQTVTQALEATRQLAEKLRLMGTPALVIASTPDGQFKQGSQPVFIPGAASEDDLKDLIQKASS